jgi:hypothetical protein
MYQDKMKRLTENISREKLKPRETESVNIIMYHPKGSVGQNLPANSKGILGLSAESLLTQKKNESSLNLKFSYLNNSERDCLTRLRWTSINWMKNKRRLWNSSKVFKKGWHFGSTDLKKVQLLFF